MDRELKNRVAALEAELAESRRPRKHGRRITVSAVAVLVITVAGAAGYWLLHRNSQAANSPLPQSVVQSANFPLYFPDTLPDGFRLDEQSVSFDNGAVFYSLTDGKGAIQISEQAMPDSLSNFKNFNDLTETHVKIGKAFFGTDKQQSAVIFAPKTLVSINGDKLSTINPVKDVASTLTQIEP
jgi:hypothetical protein